MKTTSQNGIKFIQSFEGTKLAAYKDIVGITTIGTGHTGGDVYMGQTITQAEADLLLATDLAKFEKGVNSLVTVPLTQNQFDALVSFTFNLGLGSLKTSTLLTKLNAKDYQGAADQFLRWDHAGGVVVAGLTRRRAAERALFLS